MSSRFSNFKKQCTVALLLLLAAAVIWSWAFNTSLFPNPDAFDYAQMGRQLADAKGFSTLQVFPKHIRYFHETGCLQKENWPNLYRSPLPIILNAFFYKITGPDTLVASDVAYKVALYAGCRALRLPAYPENLLEINDRFIPVDYILLSPRVFTPKSPNQPSLYETYADYLDFVKSEKFKEEFKFVKILPDRSALFESTRSIKTERAK